MRFVIGLLLAALFLAAVPTAVLAQSSAACPENYRVVRGDWLSIIAHRCEVSVADLMEANPEIKNPARIYVGQMIKIPQKQAEVQPAPEAAAPVPPVRSLPPNADFDLTMLPEDAAAGIPQMAAQAGESAETAEPLVYTVRRGDWLSVIAYKNKTSVAAILDLNPEIQDQHRIFTGQKIVIPPAGYQPSAEALERVERPNAARPVAVGTDERWIDVDLTTQKVHAFEGDTLVQTFTVSTGRARTPTVTGQYRIYVKFEKTDMRGPGYHYRDVPFTMYFFRGYGLHGTFWHNNFGTPNSAGCVNLRTEDAEWLFNFASVGTLVNVHY